jgi:nicotinate-nucleotide adenylyltransferase
MLELAVAGHGAFRVDRRELRKETPCYTVETLAEIHAEEPAAELFFLMGADSLHDFPTWREPARILELATLAVVNRGDAPEPDFRPLRLSLGERAVDRVQVVTIPGVQISSSDLRRRIADGQSIRYMTPRGVECYIETHWLYAAAR